MIGTPSVSGWFARRVALSQALARLGCLIQGRLDGGQDVLPWLAELLLQTGVESTVTGRHVDLVAVASAQASVNVPGDLPNEPDLDLRHQVGDGLCEAVRVIGGI